MDLDHSDEKKKSNVNNSSNNGEITSFEWESADSSTSTVDSTPVGDNKDDTPCVLGFSMTTGSHLSKVPIDRHQEIEQIKEIPCLYKEGILGALDGDFNNYVGCSCNTTLKYDYLPPFGFIYHMEYLDRNILEFDDVDQKSTIIHLVYPLSTHDPFYNFNYRLNRGDSANRLLDANYDMQQLNLYPDNEGIDDEHLDFMRKYHCHTTQKFNFFGSYYSPFTIQDNLFIRGYFQTDRIYTLKVFDSTFTMTRDPNVHYFIGFTFPQSNWTGHKKKFYFYNLCLNHYENICNRYYSIENPTQMKKFVFPVYFFRLYLCLLLMEKPNHFVSFTQ